MVGAAQAGGTDPPEPGAGRCGVTQRPGPVWNLYYRLFPRAQGHGYAVEAALAARAEATRVDPEVPVIASLLEHNLGSKRTAERAGLELAWRDHDHGNPDPGAVRLVYSDRPLPPDVLLRLTQGP